MTNEFIQEIETGYTFKGPSICLGAAMYLGNTKPGLTVNVPLKTLNRHGLIAGATGVGKTKTLQVIVERLSEQGVPCLVMDIKGDLSGLGAAGVINSHIEKRQASIGEPYRAQAAPIQFLTLSNEPGIRLRSTVIEFGPVLFSKMLGLNDTQSGLVSIVFKYCDDNNLALLDLEDFKTVLQYFTGDGKREVQAEYGQLSAASINTILRKVLELEQQGADKFFGEPSFEVEDLIRQENGKGIISVLRVTDIQDRPRLFSTFMLSLLAELYNTLPEEGDLEKPKLCLFIDEAHLIFSDAGKVLQEQLETIVKLIRSKGVGIFFCTQNPMDVPESILGQLGLKVQHALRAFTAKDRQTIKKTAENYPISKHYKTDELLTSLGIGEALISALNEKGIPTPLSAVLLQAPRSRMDVLSPAEIEQINKSNRLIDFYAREIDRESAHEVLSKKLAQFEKDEEAKQTPTQRTAERPTKPQPTAFESLSKNTMVRQVGNTLMRELARGLLGVLGVSGRRRRR